MTPLLTAQALGCRLGNRTVLEAVDFALAPGELVGVVGPNGAGKSTLLHCLNGTRGSTGLLRLGDRDLRGLHRKAVARLVALMAQTPSLDGGFSVRELVALGRHPHRGRGVPESPADRAQVAQALGASEIEALADRPLDTLSGGERQRVLFALALAQDPSVLLLDEPTAHLDLGSQERLFAQVRRWTAGPRGTVVAVHDLRLAARYCDRLVLLASGRVVASGPPAAVVTPGHLALAYGVDARVFPHPLSGAVDFHVPPAPGPGGPRVHVVVGGGWSRHILGLLVDQGFRGSVGILVPGDAHLWAAELLGFETLVAPAFAPVPGAILAAHQARIAGADLTVVTAGAWGAGDPRIVEAVQGARQVVVIADDSAGEGEAPGWASLGPVVRPSDFPSWFAAHFRRI